MWNFFCIAQNGWSTVYTTYVEQLQEEKQTELEEKQEKLEEMEGEMRDLKSYLYAKFGTGINLEEDQWVKNENV